MSAQLWVALRQSSRPGGVEVRHFRGADAEQRAKDQMIAWDDVTAHAEGWPLRAPARSARIEDWSLTQRTLLAARHTVAELGPHTLITVALALIDEAADLVAEAEATRR